MNLFLTLLQKLPYAKGFAGKVKLLYWKDNTAQYELLLEKHHCNLAGTLHGGMSVTLVDLYTCATCIPAYATGKLFMSTDIKTRFIAAPKVGDTILMEARVLKAGKTLASAEMHIFDKATHNLCVQGVHTMFVMDWDWDQFSAPSSWINNLEAARRTYKKEKNNIKSAELHEKK